MSVSFTVRLPKHLVEKMRKYREVNWSEVIRKAIENYLNQLEESKLEESGAELLERLSRSGVDRRDLEPLPYEEEIRLCESTRRLEWERLGSSIQAQ